MLRQNRTEILKSGQRKFFLIGSESQPPNTFGSGKSGREGPELSVARNQASLTKALLSQKVAKKFDFFAQKTKDWHGEFVLFFVWVVSGCMRSITEAALGNRYFDFLNKKFK